VNGENQEALLLISLQIDRPACSGSTAAASCLPFTRHPAFFPE
jgi:hypothetical protein